MGDFLDIDPRILRLPSSRITGADPVKLARQTAKHGISTQGMPRLFVLRGKGGELQIIDGVTRATRVAKLVPGTTVPVEVIDQQPRLDLTKYPTVEERLP